MWKRWPLIILVAIIVLVATIFSIRADSHDSQIIVLGNKAHDQELKISELQAKVTQLESDFVYTKSQLDHHNAWIFELEDKVRELEYARRQHR
jgi:hypothetical protein